MNKKVIIILLIVSFAFTVSALAWIIVRCIRSVLNKKNRGNKTVWYSLLIVGAIWCLRYAVGYYDICSADFPKLNVFEEVFNSLVHTFQSFSMDEDYTWYIENGKEMMRSVFANNALLVGIYGGYASALNVFAPVCGGAILLNILQGVFPGVRLFIKRLAFWKTKYYFSELNEGSLTCAKSIVNRKYALFCKPLIIFADVYSDGENKKSSDLLKKAKSLGGICINDDLTHLNHRFTSKKEYWLIDENELNNINILAELANKKHYKSISKSDIRIFYQNDSYTLTERAIVNQIRGEFRSDNAAKIAKETEKAFDKLMRNGGAGLTDKQKKMSEVDLKKEIENGIAERIVDKKAAAVIRTRCYQNLIYNMLDMYPLYKPLLSQPIPKTLDVAIIGNGEIGMEMLLSTYWHGQLLDIPLSVNMVSKDDPDTACAKINKVNSDILQSTKAKSSMLRVFPDDAQIDENEKYNPPYFSFRYCRSDVDFDDISSLKCTMLPEYENEEVPKTADIIDSDYFMVALGSDGANIRVAEELCKAISAARKKSGSTKKALINFAVFDSHLCRSLNNEYATPISDEVEMHAVGCLDEVYSYENVVMSQLSKGNERITNTYKKLSHADMMTESNNRIKKLYEYWSTKANNCHYPYKVFSAYVYWRKKDDSIKWNDWESEHQRYICTEKNALADSLAWLEHRRWNAYLRSVGFKYSDKIPKDKKDIIRRIHPCLAECKRYPDANSADDFLDLVRKCPEKECVKLYDYSGVISDELLDGLKTEAGQKAEYERSGEEQNGQ